MPKNAYLLFFFIILFFVLSLCVHKLQARHTVATIIKIIGCYGMRQLKSMTACPIYIYISPHAHLHRYQHQNKMATAVVYSTVMHIFGKNMYRRYGTKEFRLFAKKKITLPKVMIHRRHTHF